MSKALHPRLPTNRCAKCLSEIKPGDRVSIAHIAIKTGKNNLKEIGIWLSDEFELIHVDCINPQLSHVTIIK